MNVVPLVRMTLVERLRQPVTWLMTAVSLALLGISFLFGQFNFENQDRLRMLATSGVAVAVLNGLFLAVLGASQTIHDELASRTALTLFAKPLGRGTYLMGKALAVWITTVISGLVLAGAHLGLLAWVLHHGFEIDEHHHGIDLDDLWLPWSAVISGHVMAVAHGAVMTCLATVLALRLPLVANILTCFALFSIGHLLAGMGMMGYGPLPALTVFNIDDCIQFRDRPVSAAYVLMTGLYTALYCAGCLFSGLALFRRQDIA
jgi:hypothetical protein